MRAILIMGAVVMINSFRFGATTPLLTNVEKLSLDPATSVGTRVDVSDGFYVSGFGDARDGFYFEYGIGGDNDGPRYIHSLPFNGDTDPFCVYTEGTWSFQNTGVAAAAGAEANPWSADWSSLTLTHPAHQQLNAASTAINGQFVSLAGTAEVNAVYTKRGTSGGKDYYNQLGQPDDTTTYSIVWGDLGGILGTGWGINGAGAVLDYYSLDAVSRPDQVTTWIAINVDQVPTVTSLTAGDLVAGFKTDDATLIVNGSEAGRNKYSDVLGMLADVVWIPDDGHGGGNFWEGGDIQNFGNEPFPFSGTPEITVTKSNVAAESNWGEVP